MKTETEVADYVLRFINQTNRSLFLTGKAGTGKTTLLREIIRSTHKNTVVVAPTGIAALNAGGVTIHSMFQLPFAAFIPDENVPYPVASVRIETRQTLRRHFRVSATKLAVIKNMELLIIDEVSMLRTDLLDGIDFMLQSVRKNKLPFGGVQMLFIGDLLQLPPVIKNDEWLVLKNYYSGKFFFHSHAVLKNPPLYVELTKVFRQTDSSFVDILNNLRNNTITTQDLKVLNQFVQPTFDYKANSGYITLTTHNATADEMNANSLKDLSARTFSFNAEVVGDFPEKIFPVDEFLQLKIGAQVMFVKNDLSIEKNYFNGKTGIIKSLSEQEIVVQFPEEGKAIEVERYEWKNIRYFFNETTKEIEEEVLGTFVHYPIKLAWAITVHKSQGLTFDKAALDVSRVFLPGQAYVALSRLRSLEGLVLLSPLQMNGISNDYDVMQYALNRAEDDVLNAALQIETKRFIHQYVRESFDWQELAQEWRNHYFSYHRGDKSVKSNYEPWALLQRSAIEAMIDPSAKFLKQLDRLFEGENFDISHIAQRIDAAAAYFVVPMDNIVTELLWKLEELSRIKKVKSFYEELAIIEESQTKAVLRILKAKKLIETLVKGQEISRENLLCNEIKNYHSDKLQIVRDAFTVANAELLEEDDHLHRYQVKTAKIKVPKKSTVQETYELWITKMSIREIATARKLTTQTISNHIAKLIESKTINILDVLPEDKVIELARAFIGYTEDTLNGLKEKYGDKFTWDELKMFKASLH